MRVRESNEVLGIIKTPEDGYLALAAAIIAMACDDYLRAAQHSDSMRMQSVEHFLLSERFMVFSRCADGSYILRKLQEAVARGGNYEEPKEAVRVIRYDRFYRPVEEYPSIAEAARSVGSDRHTLRRGIAAGRMVCGSYWELA